MKPTILMVPRMPEALTARLAEHFTLLGPMEHSTPEALPAGAEQAEALLTMGSLSTNAALIDALPQLRLICCYGTGIEGVDR
ncbi:2-hydroxyacid dehydrogenase, partial [Bosea sp. CER48]